MRRVEGNLHAECQELEVREQRLPDHTGGQRRLPGGLTPVYRAYNNGFAKGIDSNHRITSNFASYQQTVAAGSIGEGIVMCAPPSAARAPLLLSPDGTTVYDIANNVSWLADFNLPASNRFGLPVCTSTADPKTCVNASGSMSYQAATAWVNAMNAANYLGHGDWQLPTTPSPDASCPMTGPGAIFGFDCAASALGSLYYNAFGIPAPNTAVPIPTNTVGPFSNFQPYQYWSQSSEGGTGYYTFSFNSGWVGANTVPNFIYVVPMIPGKIPGTPAATGTVLQVNPGGQTVYDPVTNVTWLANTNLAATNTFGLPRCTAPTNPTPCVNQDGAMSWDTANQFVASMNAYNGTGYLGQKNWELPPIDSNCTDYNCADTGNPMGESVLSPIGCGFRHGRRRGTQHRCRPIQQHSALSLLGLRGRDDSGCLPNRWPSPQLRVEFFLWQRLSGYRYPGERFVCHRLFRWSSRSVKRGGMGLWVQSGKSGKRG